MNEIELQDREFVAAIREQRAPNASVQHVLSCYRYRTSCMARALKPIHAARLIRGD